MQKLKGFDVRDLDTSVRPQDDFYRYANGGWMKHNTIPKTESCWGTFQILHHEAQHDLKKIVEELLTKKGVKAGSDEQRIRDLYRSGMDMQTRNRLGAKPIAALRERIKKVADRKDLFALVAHLQKLGVDAPWGFMVDQDSKDSSRYALHLCQSGLGLPDRDYYLTDDAEFVRVRTAYIAHLARIFGLLGYKTDEAASRAQTVLRVETALAKVSMDKVDVRDAEKTYHKKTLAQLGKLAPQIDWHAHLKSAGIPPVKDLIVSQPDFVKAAAALLASLPLEEWQTYFEWHVADDASGFLSAQFVKANFAFSQVLVGTPRMKPLWRRTLGTVNGMLGDALGKLYVARHFNRATKHKMDELVSDLFDVYEERIKALDWMSVVTKQKAVKKLRMMNRKIGYPKKWRSYAGVVIRPDAYFENALRLSEHARRREMRKLMRKSIDRDEWFMSPQTVNAYHYFNMNEIVFPAAILQPPLFNPDADDAFNYAATGWLIGHEMTHGFDDQGAKFDGDGNMKTWWTTADKTHFEEKGEAIVTQYDAFKVDDGVPVNGKLTLGENIADFGGMAIAYDAYQKHLAKTGRQTIGGLTPEQRFFLGYARAEQQLHRPEWIKTIVLTDSHSPAEFRINGPLVHFEPFYEAFDVKPGDALYRDPTDRVKIW